MIRVCMWIRYSTNIIYVCRSLLPYLVKIERIGRFRGSEIEFGEVFVQRVLGDGLWRGVVLVAGNGTGIETGTETGTGKGNRWWPNENRINNRRIVIQRHLRVSYEPNNLLLRIRIRMLAACSLIIHCARSECYRRCDYKLRVIGDISTPRAVVRPFANKYTRIRKCNLSGTRNGIRSCRTVSNKPANIKNKYNLLFNFSSAPTRTIILHKLT